MNRRQFIGLSVGAGTVGIAGAVGWYASERLRAAKQSVFIARAHGYQDDLAGKLLAGFKSLSFAEADVRGKTVLLKPNLVEPARNVEHINTHPSLVQAAIETFLRLGARSVRVGEGSGHRTDPIDVLHEAGYWDVLGEDKTPFIDLNNDEVVVTKNRGPFTGLQQWTIPRSVHDADIVVSMAKMKTHHWVGATLSMKNLFGIMPGRYYGWPKNVLHQRGIPQSIVDIYMSTRVGLAIVDGIVGMEGDGPIMGLPVESNVIVLGRHLPSVDATAARIMDIDPGRLSYLGDEQHRLWSLDEDAIEQRGERILDVTRPYSMAV